MDDADYKGEVYFWSGRNENWVNIRWDYYVDLKSLKIRSLIKWKRTGLTKPK